MDEPDERWEPTTRTPPRLEMGRTWPMRRTELFDVCRTWEVRPHAVLLVRGAPPAPVLWLTFLPVGQRGAAMSSSQLRCSLLLGAVDAGDEPRTRRFLLQQGLPAAAAWLDLSIRSARHRLRHEFRVRALGTSFAIESS